MSKSSNTIQWMFIYGVVNILLHLSNHHVSKSNISTEILFLQSFIAFLAQCVFYSLWSTDNKTPFPSWKETRDYGPVALFHAGSLYSMFRALKYCSVRTVGVSRFVAPIVTSLYEGFIVRSIRWSRQQFLCLVGIFIGAILSFRDVEFYGHVLSIPWIALNVLCTASGTTFAKYLLQHHLCPTQASLLENFYCSVVFLTQSFWSETWQTKAWKQSSSWSLTTKVSLVISCFIGYVITLSRQHLRKELGTTKFLVFAGTIRINSLFLVSKWFSKSLSWSGFIGVMMIVGFSLRYLLYEECS